MLRYRQQRIGSFRHQPLHWTAVYFLGGCISLVENSATDLDELQMPSSEEFSRSSQQLQPSRLTVSGREMKCSVQTARRWKILCILHS